MIRETKSRQRVPTHQQNQVLNFGELGLYLSHYVLPSLLNVLINHIQAPNPPGNSDYFPESPRVFCLPQSISLCLICK